VFLAEVATAEAAVTNDALSSIPAVLEAASRLAVGHFDGESREDRRD